MVLKDSIALVMEKYGLTYEGGDFQGKIKSTVADILNEVSRGKKVAVRGAGTHTRELLMLEGDSDAFGLIFDYSVEEKETRFIAGKDRMVCPSAALSEFDVDTVLISSYAHRKAMRIELEQLGKGFEIVDLYDELQKRGLYVNAPFYQNSEDSYENVAYFRSLYHADKNARNLKNLIIAYLKIYDFINFEKYAEKYTVKKYSYYKEVGCAVWEIKKILSYARAKLKKRKQRDIIIVWNDQVGYSDLKLAPFLYEESKNSLFFENAYTMTPFTVPTFYEMFMGLKSIDDEVYYRTIPIFNRSNSEMLSTIAESGYEFVYIGDEADARLFEKEEAIPNYTYNSSCVRCMDLLQKLLDSEKPVCAILHALVETHNPYLSGELDRAKWYEWPWFDGMPEEVALKQMEKSLQYWDSQLAYYMDFLSDQSVRIYMSDHGKRYNYQPIWKEPTTHIICFVTGRDVPVCRYNQMFSIYDFNKLIGCAIQNNYKEEEICKEYALMQETDIFNLSAIRYYVENNAEECTFAFRAVRTTKELYVKLSSGKKYYYKLPDEETNCINSADGKRLEWLDSLAGNKFINVRERKELLGFFRKQFETHE